MAPVCACWGVPQAHMGTRGACVAQIPGASRRGTTGLCRVGKGARPRRRDGRSPSRRPGGPAPQWWQRRPRRPPVTPQTHPRTDGLDRRGAVLGGRTTGAWPPGTVRPGRWPGGTPQPRTLPERRFSGGSKGGGSTPRQSANVLHRVGWLTDLKSVQPALGGSRVRPCRWTRRERFVQRSSRLSPGDPVKGMVRANRHPDNQTRRGGCKPAASIEPALTSTRAGVPAR